MVFSNILHLKSYTFQFRYERIKYNQEGIQKK